MKEKVTVLSMDSDPEKAAEGLRYFEGLARVYGLELVLLAKRTWLHKRGGATKLELENGAPVRRARNGTWMLQLHHDGKWLGETPIVPGKGARVMVALMAGSRGGE